MSALVTDTLPSANSALAHTDDFNRGVAMLSPCIAGLKAAADRTAEIRRKAAVVGIDVGPGFVNDWTARRVEKLYADAMAEAASNPLFTPQEAQEYHAYLDSINADLDAAEKSPTTQLDGAFA